MVACSFAADTESAWHIMVVRPFALHQQHRIRLTHHGNVSSCSWPWQETGMWTVLDRFIDMKIIANIYYSKLQIQ